MDNKMKNYQPGQTFGYLTLLEKEPSKEGVSRKCVWWKCICVCGNEIRVPSDNFRRKTPNCGCKTKELRSIVHIRQDTQPNEIYQNYKARAKNKGLEFSLTKEEFLGLITSSCSYCGTEPNQKLRNRGGILREFKYNGIDRIDSTVGYVRDNCTPCCGTCNFAKGSHTKEEFIDWIRRVATHLEVI